MYKSATAPVPPTTEFNVLGPLTVVVDGTAVRLGGPRQIAVLGRLVLSPGHVVSMDQLVDSVWDGDAPKRPDVAIRSYVSNLRRSIEPNRDPGDRRSCIESSSPGYRLNVDRPQIDAHRFERLLAAGQSALEAGDPAAAMVNFDEALNLWRGDVCEGMVENDAVVAFRSRLNELRLAMVELSSAARLELGELEGVIADVEAAIALHPLRERLTELAMLALYRAGRQSDALAVCRELRSRLIESLGVTPGRPIEELEHRILTHDPTLGPDVPPTGRVDWPTAPRTDLETTAEVPSAGGGAAPSGTSSPAQHHVGGPAAADPSPSVDAVANGSGPHTSAVEGDRDRLGMVMGTSLVGRDHELTVLAGVACDLAAGRGRTVVITGESGIGKTTLVQEFARFDIGARAVWGRCRPIASSLALWPWGQVLDGLAADAEPDLVDRIGSIIERSPSGSDQLAMDFDDDLFVDRCQSMDSIEPDERSDGAPLFRPIVESLRISSRRAPLIVVIDDAQWADPSSIELLAFASTALADEAIVFVVAWREPNATGPTAGLRALGRPPNVVRIPLSPLDRIAVEDLLERIGIFGGTLAARILAETAGNPSFIAELVADLSREGDGASDRDPTGGVAVALRPTAALRDRVLDRLEEADAEAEAILTVAAINGPGFTGDVIAEVVELPSGRVDEALERLVSAGLVAGEPGAIGYRFAHPIVAKTLIKMLSSPRRARLHTAVGHALWRRGAPEVVLARHFSKAGSAGTALLAARFALTAARGHLLLDDLFELEEIVRTGLEAMSGVDRSDALASELGMFLCQVARVRGHRSEHRRLAAEATRAAEFAEDPKVIAAAVLATTGTSVDGPVFAGGSWVGTAIDADRGARVRLADKLRELGPDNPLAVAIALRIVRLQVDVDDPRSAFDPAELAELRTARSGDGASETAERHRFDDAADLLAYVELARLVLSRGDADSVLPLIDRLGVARSGASRFAPARLDQDEPVVDRGSMATILDHRLDAVRSVRHNGQERLLAARLRLVDAFDRSDPLTIDAVVDDLRALPPPGTATGALDLDRLALESTALLPLGELSRVETSIGRARSRCQRVGLDSAAFDRQALVLRWVQGKLDDPTTSGEGRSAQLDPLDELAIRALAAVGRGDVEPARDLIAELVASPGWRSLLVDPADVGVVGLVAIVAAQAGDEVTAGVVFEKLVGWTDRTVPLWGGLVLLGPGCMLAGIAAAAAGDRRTAHALLAASEDRCRAVGARAWLRQTLAAQAGLAATMGDRGRADRLWAESVELATEMVTGRREPDRDR